MADDDEAGVSTDASQGTALWLGDGACASYYTGARYCTTAA